MVDVTGIEPVTPLLAKIGRTKNQQLTTIGEELLLRDITGAET